MTIIAPPNQSETAIEIYGSVVIIPDIVDLPLRPARSHNDKPAVLRVTTSPVAEPVYTQQLDDVVSLSYRDGVISVQSEKDLGPRAMEHYIVDHAIPRGLTLLGKLVLHGAGVVNSASRLGALLVGDSGAGKSTTSTFLSKNGWQILGDDAVGLYVNQSVCTMHPAYPSVRLATNSTTSRLVDKNQTEKATLVAEYTSKTRISLDPENYNMQPTRLSHIVLLARDIEFNVKYCGSAETCKILVQHTFFPPAANRAALSRLELLKPYAEALSGYVVDYPRDFEGLELLNRFLSELRIPEPKLSGLSP